jgi:hypothetical protein
MEWHSNQSTRSAHRKWRWTGMGGGNKFVLGARGGTRRVCSKPLRPDFMDNQMAENNLASPFSPNSKKDRLQNAPSIIC